LDLKKPISENGDGLYCLKELENLRFHFGASSQWGGRRYLPYAFTEQGVAMLSSVPHTIKKEFRK
jgi:hypothetical protein